MCLFLCLASKVTASVEFTEAKLWLITEGETQMLAVSMPDHWNVQRRQISVQGWYEINVRLPEELLNQSQLGVFIPNSSGLLSVYWDDEYIGGTVPLNSTGVPMVSGPLLVSVPTSLRSAQEHLLRLDFQGTPGIVNFVRAPVIGELAELRNRYVTKRLTLVYLPMSLSVVSIIFALVFFATYRKDPSSYGVGWVTVGLMAASLSVIGLYISLPEVFSDMASRIRSMMYHLSFLFFLFAVDELRRTRSWLTYVVGVIYSLFAVAALLVDVVQVYSVAALWMPFSYALGIYLLVRVVKLAKGVPRRRVALLPIALMPLLLVHDLVGITTGSYLWADQFLVVFNPPLLALSLMLVMVNRTRMHVSEVLTLNTELEDRVEQKHAELQANYARIADAERREAVLQERERMVRDMHDGLGGQLVSTLAMVESGHFSNSEVEDALRDSLDDLRMMAHSLDLEESSLIDLLAMIRERVEPRITRQDLRFRWRVKDIAQPYALSPEAAGHILRILQECLTNIIKHAQAHTITLSTGVEDDRGFVSIEDDGVGMNNSNQVRDAKFRRRGLRNMQHRAEQLGGSLTIEPGANEQGTRVTLWFAPSSVTS